MVKFVESKKGSEKSVNKEGGVAYAMSPEKKLLNLTATCMFGEDKFYGSVEDEIKKTLAIVAKKDPKFPLQLAAYVRDELHLRTTPIALLVMSANDVKCKPYVRHYSPLIIQRADELCETLAAQLKMFGKPIPNSLKKGVADSFAKFSEYSFAKYNRDGDVKLRDAIILTHAKKPSELIKKILDDKLETPDTWEAFISTNGSTKENWGKILPAMPYMSRLRNVNNFLKVGLTTDKFLPHLENKEAVLKSKQLPFRFYSALKSIHTEDPFAEKEVAKTLEKAMEHSIENLPKMMGRTVIAVDLSMSMDKAVSEKSIVTHKQISSLFGAMSNRFSDNAVVYGFGDTIKRIPLTGRILEDAKTIERTKIGCSTNGHLVINDLIDNKIITDRIIFFTDEELWNNRFYWRSEIKLSLQDSFSKYKTINPNVKLYIVNVNGYGESCVSRHDKSAITINGFSENVLKFIEVEENDQVAYIKEKY